MRTGHLPEVQAALSGKSVTFTASELASRQQLSKPIPGTEWSLQVTHGKYLQFALVGPTSRRGEFVRVVLTLWILSPYQQGILETAFRNYINQLICDLDGVSTNNDITIAFP